MMVDKKKSGWRGVETLQQKDRRGVNMIQRIEHDFKMLAVAVANGVKQIFNRGKQRQRKDSKDHSEQGGAPVRNR